MSSWMLMQKKADFFGLAEKLGVDPVVVRLMANRGLVDLEEMRGFLHPSLELLHNPRDLAGIDDAIAIIMDAIDAGAKIRIIGDYDVDGVMSTYILKSALKKVGADVDYAIPNRMEDGYGINKSMIDKALLDGVDLIITCDNGIAAGEVTSYARENGLAIVVTDHHDVPFNEVDGEKIDILPEADAVVNPKRRGQAYPFTEICGAVVAWKVMTVLYEDLGMEDDEINRLLPYAAFATVCDVMSLTDENRPIVVEGIKAMDKTQDVGIRALIESCDLEGPLTVHSLGFVLGPCINATGRLDSATMAIELLEEEDFATALKKARVLRELNDTRKDYTLEGFNQAEEQVAKNNLSDKKVIVLYMPEIHESIAGIVAGRICDKYHRPTFVLCDGSEGIKGSGRSVSAFNMFEELSKHKELFQHFGGHAMAAGVTLKEGMLEEFDRAINADCTLSEKDLEKTIHIDIKMPFSYITEKLIDEINSIGPFGNGNPKPIFAMSGVKILKTSLIGKEKTHVLMEIDRGDGIPLNAIYFNGEKKFYELLVEKKGEAFAQYLYTGSINNISMDMTYYPQINEFRDSKSIQIVVGEMR